MAKWWDPDHHILGEPVAEMIFEPRVGGVIIDRGVNGAESRWATVLAYDPPTRVAFSWSINLAWQIEADLAKASEVHVSFTAQGRRAPGRSPSLAIVGSIADTVDLELVEVGVPSAEGRLQYVVDL